MHYEDAAASHGAPAARRAELFVPMRGGLTAARTGRQDIDTLPPASGIQ